MKITKSLLLILSLYNSNSFADNPNRKETNSSSCHAKRQMVIDEFVDTYRQDIGRCENSFECTWQDIGSGVDVNTSKYYKFLSCFEYAVSMSDEFCKTQPIVENNKFGGNGMGHLLAPWPSKYECVKNQCKPIYLMPSTLAGRPPKLPKYSGKNNEVKTEIDNCKERVDKTFPGKLKSGIKLK